jgi:hypothetical protein
MNTLTIDTPVQLSTYADSYRSLIMQATLGQVEAASVWYYEAQEVAEDVAELLGKSLEVGASVVSAFSPRERWSSNVAKAYAFASGKPVKGLSNNLTMANNSLELGFDALKGQKTNAFARAIAGDENAVVIDVWMCKAANVSFDSPNKTQYREMCEAVVSVANEFGLTPRTAQALIWIVKRGSAS